jgi:hypothetical protein
MSAFWAIKSGIGGEAAVIRHGPPRRKMTHSCRQHPRGSATTSRPQHRIVHGPPRRLRGGQNMLLRGQPAVNTTARGHAAHETQVCKSAISIVLDAAQASTCLLGIPRRFEVGFISREGSALELSAERKGKE